MAVKFVLLRNKTRDSDGATVVTYRCAHHNYTYPKCPYRVRVITRGFPRTESWEIQVYKDLHVDHDVCCVTKKRGLPLQKKNILSPGKLNQLPSDAAVSVAKGGDSGAEAKDLTDKSKAQIERLAKKLRTTAKHNGGSMGKSSTWGALARSIEKCKLDFCYGLMQ